MVQKAYVITYITDEMIPSDIEKGIQRYLANTASEKELKDLGKWVKDPSNKKLFKDYVLLHHAINAGLNEIDDRPGKDRLIREIRKKEAPAPKRKNRVIFRLVAVFLIVLGLAYLYHQNFGDTVQQQFVDPNQITLQLENGNIMVIDEEGKRKITDANGNEVGIQTGNTLSYGSGREPDELVYNQLNIPHGKQFELELADGSTVFLNSGSSIKYPVSFLPGKAREVSLEGEAYFKVEKDSVCPFVVNVGDLRVRVLGTQFNLSSYPEDNDVTTVLVEGLVGLYNKEVYRAESATLMKPGFKGVYDPANGSISLEEVDTGLYTSWKTGRIVFRGAQFKNIIKKLERTYNVSIVNNNKELEEQYFSASFDIDDNMEQILSSFNRSYKFNYVIENNIITIN